MKKSEHFVNLSGIDCSIQETADPLQVLLANAPQKRREEITKAVTEAARKYADSTGSVKLSNEAICVVGTK